MRHENRSWHEGILKDINRMQERSIDMRGAYFLIKHFLLGNFAKVLQRIHG